MPKYHIKGSNGSTYEVSAADDAQAARMEGFINSRIAAGDDGLYGGAPPDGGLIDRDRTAETKAMMDRSSPAGLGTLAMQGATAGLSDEASGVGNAIVNMVTSPFSERGFHPVDAYVEGRNAERQRIREAEQQYPTLGGIVEGVSGIASAAPAGFVKAAPRLLGAIKEGAKLGAIGGALGGFGTGEGAEGSAIQGVLGAAGGGALGAALPVAGQVVANRVGGLSRLLGRDQGGTARNIVANALTADAGSPRAVGNVLASAQERGSPMMMADTGDNARALLASVARQSPGARALVRSSVIPRQEGQGDRIASAIGRDLGPVGNMRQASDDLMTQARTAAGPLYDEAYAAPGRTSEALESLLATPAGRQALGRARMIAANEQRDPLAMGFDLDAQGDTILTQVPSVQTLDYVKRGLDDIVEQYRDPITSRLTLDEAGRAINGVRARFLNEVDTLNPKYAEARAAYAGPASAEEALQLGRKSLNGSAEDIEAAVGRMSDFEREHFGLGFRGAMVDHLGKVTDATDSVGKLLGTPRKRAALAEVFGGEDEFSRFIATMGDERAMNETYRSVATGSQSAERLADDARSADTGLAEDAVGAALRGSKDGIVPAVVNALSKLRDVDKFGAGQAGDSVRESVASLLSQTDPAQLAELIRAANRAEAVQRVTSRATKRVTTGGAGVLSRALSVPIGR